MRLVGLRTITCGKLGIVVRRMIADRDCFPELAAAHRRFVSGRRAAGRLIVVHAIERGEIRDDLDPDLVWELAASPIFYRAVISGERGSNFGSANQ